MNAQDVDAVVKRANEAGFASLAAYAVALEDENARLRESVQELLKWAEAARGHYGIEECGGPGQPATEWDDVQDGLRGAALFARGVLEEVGS